MIYVMKVESPGDLPSAKWDLIKVRDIWLGQRFVGRQWPTSRFDDQLLNGSSC